MLRALVFALLLPTPALAQDCRLALAMGFDVSRSVDARDWRVQMDGILAALADGAVQDALFASPLPVALALYEWSGEYEQTLIADWALMRTPADLATLVDQITRHPRSHAGLTAVGPALRFGHRLLGRAPDCRAQTLDISGDGYANVGALPARVYARVDFGAITVNGLAIGGHESAILAWFTTEVARGPGAFVEFAPTHQDFAATFRRKLLRELSPPLMGLAPQAAGTPRALSISVTVSSIP